MQIFLKALWIIKNSQEISSFFPNVSPSLSRQQSLIESDPIWCYSNKAAGKHFYHPPYSGETLSPPGPCGPIKSGGLPGFNSGRAFDRPRKLTNLSQKTTGQLDGLIELIWDGPRCSQQQYCRSLFIT